jgi:hypothetical protein
MSSSHKLGEVGTEIAPELAPDDAAGARESCIRELADLVGAALDALRFAQPHAA